MPLLYCQAIAHDDAKFQQWPFTTTTAQYKCKQCKSRLRCIVALAWIVSSDTVCTSLIFSQWGAHLNSASTVPLLHLCLDCLYVRSKITSNARCIALCSMMCALYYALHYAHCAVHMTTASFTPIQSGHSWNPQGHSGTLRNTQEHSGTLRDTHGTLEDNQGHSWNPQGHSWNPQGHSWNPQ